MFKLKTPGRKGSGRKSGSGKSFGRKSFGRRGFARKGLRGELEDLATLLRDYVVQEIVGPLRGVRRYIGYGIAGSFFISLSVLLCGIGLLRLLQTEVSLFADTWSFAPYLITVLLMLLILMGLLKAVSGSSTPKTDMVKTGTTETDTAKTDASSKSGAQNG